MVRFHYGRLALLLGIGYNLSPAKAQYCMVIPDDDLSTASLSGGSLGTLNLDTDTGQCYASRRVRNLDNNFSGVQNGGMFFRFAEQNDSYRVACDSSDTFTDDYDRGYVTVRVRDNEVRSKATKIVEKKKENYQPSPTACLSFCSLSIRILEF